MIIHEVDGYPVWKAIFDNAAEIRKNAGEIRHQLLRDDQDENLIVHFSEWTSLENARQIFESPELVEIRKKAGVKAPNFVYLREVEPGALLTRHLGESARQQPPGGRWFDPHIGTPVNR